MTEEKRSRVFLWIVIGGVALAFLLAALAGRAGAGQDGAGPAEHGPQGLAPGRVGHQHLAVAALQAAPGVMGTARREGDQLVLQLLHDLHPGQQDGLVAHD